MAGEEDKPRLEALEIELIEEDDEEPVEHNDLTGVTLAETGPCAPSPCYHGVACSVIEGEPQCGACPNGYEVSNLNIGRVH